MSFVIETPTPLDNDASSSTFCIPPTQDDDSTIESFHAAIEQMRMSKKNYEEGYRCVKKYEQNSGNTYLLEYFTTKNIIGQPIRNARTGYIYSKYRVGSLSECLFFKTHLSTKESFEAQNNSSRIFSQKHKHTSVNKLEPEILFYDCPEEYETHHKVALKQELKDQWRARYERLLRHLEKRKRAPATENRDSHIQILSSSKSSTAPSQPGSNNTEPLKKRPPSPEGPPPGYGI